MNRRRWLKLASLFPASAVVWSCVAPILTVPPPSQVGFVSDVETESDGTERTFWIASAGPLAQAANATFFLTNQALGAGVIATARNDGSFTAPPMEGTASDHVLIYYKTPYGDYSDSVCVLLSAAAGSVAPLCPE
jgi:hypothetical protein